MRTSGCTAAPCTRGDGDRAIPSWGNPMRNATQRRQGGGQTCAGGWGSRVVIESEGEARLRPAPDLWPPKSAGESGRGAQETVAV